MSQADQDDFWSDFSDDDCEIDKHQEDIQLDIFYNLQTWLNSNSDINFLKLFTQFSTNEYSNLISCQHLLEVLQQSGYEYCQDSMTHSADLMCLIRAISCTQTQTMLNMPCTTNQNTKSAFTRTEKGLVNYK